LADTSWRIGEVNRREKEQVISELHGTLREFKAVIFTDFRGLNVEEITRLRRQLQEASVEYRVVKNTLMRLASKETGLEGVSDLFVGPTAMAVSNDDPLAPARVLSAFSKETPMLEIKGGIVEGRVVGPREIEGMAKLPGQEVLLGSLLRLLKAGQFRLVNVLSAQITRLVQVLEAIRITRQGEEKAKAEAEVEVKEEAEEKAKAEVEVKEEAEEKAKAEVEEKAKAEVEVKEEAEEKAKAEVEVKEEGEEEAKAAVEVKEEAEEEAKAEAEVKEEAEEEAKAEVKEEAEEEAKAEAEVKEETEEKAKAEAEVKGEAEKKAKAEVEEEAKKEPKKEEA
jgi:large subunit ribosomal protein L10